MANVDAAQVGRWLSFWIDAERWEEIALHVHAEHARQALEAGAWSVDIMPGGMAVGDTRKAAWTGPGQSTGPERSVTWRDQHTPVTDQGETARVLSVHDWGDIQRFECEAVP